MGFPLYLTFHFVGRDYSPEWVNHFNPYSSLFRPKQRLGVVVSDIALAVVAFGVYTLYQRYGLLWICLRYIIPYMVRLVCVNLVHSRLLLWEYCKSTPGKVDAETTNYGGCYVSHSIGQTVALSRSRSHLETSDLHSY